MTRQPPLIRELLTPAVLLVFAGYLVVNLFLIDASSADFPGPRFFPAIIAGLMLLLLAIELLGIFRRRAAHAVETTGGSTAASAQPHDDDAEAPFDWSALLWTVGGFLLFILTLRLLGWVLGAALLFWCVARGFGNRSPITSLVVGLTISSLAYIAFDMALGLNLPSGILGRF